MRSVRMIQHLVCDFCGKEWEAEIDHEQEFDRIRVSIRGEKYKPFADKELEVASYEKVMEGDVICGDCIKKVMDVLKNGKEIVN